jgi:amino acid transporter
VSRTLNPYIGWFSGWVQLAANVLFCAAAPLLAGAYTLQLFNSFGWISSDVASDNRWIAVVGVLWLALVTFMVVRGIRITANFQWLLVFIEYLIVLGFAVAALVQVVSGHHPAATAFSGSWFSPGELGGIGGVATGAALAVFFFWGWDTAANVNEETKAADTSPGKAGILSMFILLFIFLLAIVAIQMFLSQNALNDPNNQTDILYYFAQQLSGNPLAYLMVVAVLSSTVATTQTTLLPSSRLTFSMARDGVFPKAFGHVHAAWKTPWVGTIISSVLATVVIVLSVTVDSFNTNVFGNLILDIGVLVAFYYGVTGLASAWAFRKVLFSSARLFIFAGFLPLVGGLILLAIAGYVVYLDVSSALPILVTMGLGVPLLGLAAATSRSGFFREKTVSYVLVDGKLTASPASPIS